MYREFKSDPIMLQAKINRVLISLGLYRRQPNPHQYVCMCNSYTRSFIHLLLFYLPIVLIDLQRLCMYVCTVCLR
jgi:hypothetical protein